MGLLMPVGGEAIWGNHSWSPEGQGLGEMLTFSKISKQQSMEENLVCTENEGNVCESTSFEKNVTKMTSDKSDECHRKHEVKGVREEMTGRDKYLLQQVEAASISEERRKHVSEF